MNQKIKISKPSFYFSLTLYDKENLI